jgi:two-component system OmpR family sensor kinase
MRNLSTRPDVLPSVWRGQGRVSSIGLALTWGQSSQSSRRQRFLARYIDADGNLRALEPHQAGNLASVDWVPGEPENRAAYSTIGVNTEPCSLPKLKAPRLWWAFPSREIRVTIARLNIIIIAVVAIVVMVAASIGALLVRYALKPLDRITETASAVTKQPLDRGDVRLALRVPPQYANTESEVGQVGAALNLMLDHVDEAFSLVSRAKRRCASLSRMPPTNYGPL